MPQHITVTEYNPDWPRMYAEEEKKITAILGENALAVRHIGSTAVPGLAAKPVIDILVSVRSLEAVDAASADFVRADYEFPGEFGIPGRRYLRKGGDERTHQIHIFRSDDTFNITRHLAVRDYLRMNREEQKAYAELKKELARRFPYDIEGYCSGKAEFMQKLEERALAVYNTP